MLVRWLGGEFFARTGSDHIPELHMPSDSEKTQVWQANPDTTQPFIGLTSGCTSFAGALGMQVVGGDITDFEYTPKPEFDGPFTIFNEPNELALLRRFFDHMREVWCI